MATLTKEQSKTQDGEQRLTKDVYARVTDRIIADLEKGIRPWMKPWHAEHAAGKITRPLRHNGKPYRGINILLLWGESMAKGYTTPIWMTFKQALELDAHVRKGEHGSLVVFANTVTRTERDENGDDVERDIPFMKGYTVFNCEQIEGLPQHYYARPENPASIRAHRRRRPLPGRHGRDDPARREHGFLRAGERRDPDAALRGVQGQGKLLRHGAA